MKKNTQSPVGNVVAISAGLVALAASGYFLFGPNGKKNRKAIKSWTLKAKAEILEKIEKLESVTPEKYTQIVSAVMAKYEKMKDIAPAELKSVTDELHRHWKMIERDHSPKKAGKKMAKKTTTKAKK